MYNASEMNQPRTTSTKQISVILEGYGGAGKTKQAELIAESLRESGQNVCIIKLPCYGTPTGVLIRKILYEGYPFFPQEGASMQKLFSLNRDEILYWVKQVRDMGFSLIVDRWVSSNAVSIAAKRLKGRKLRRSLEAQFKWAKSLDEEFLSLFKDIPLTKIFLAVDPKSARKSRESREDLTSRHDIFEETDTEGFKASLLRQFIDWEGDWNIVQRKERAEETANECLRVIQKNGGLDIESLAELWIKGPRKKGRLLHFDEILTYTFTKEVLEGINRGLDEAVARQEELQNSLVWIPEQLRDYNETANLALRGITTVKRLER